MDGNGRLYQNGVGLACHLGVLANIVTIGVAKNMYPIGTHTVANVKEAFRALVAETQGTDKRQPCGYAMQRMRSSVRRSVMVRG